MKDRVAELLSTRKPCSAGQHQGATSQRLRSSATGSVGDCDLDRDTTGGLNPSPQLYGYSPPCPSSPLPMSGPSPTAEGSSLCVKILPTYGGEVNVPSPFFLHFNDLIGSKRELFCWEILTDVAASVRSAVPPAASPRPLGQAREREHSWTCPPHMGTM